jgi:hypothetical protein
MALTPGLVHGMGSVSGATGARAPGSELRGKGIGEGIQGTSSKLTSHLTAIREGTQHHLIVSPRDYEAAKRECETSLGKQVIEIDFTGATNDVFERIRAAFAVVIPSAASATDSFKLDRAIEGAGLQRLEATIFVRGVDSLDVDQQVILRNLIENHNLAVIAEPFTYLQEGWRASPLWNIFRNISGSDEVTVPTPLYTPARLGEIQKDARICASILRDALSSNVIDGMGRTPLEARFFRAPGQAPNGRFFVCISGQPRSGKSTAVNAIRDRLSSDKIPVYYLLGEASQTSQAIEADAKARFGGQIPENTVFIVDEASNLNPDALKWLLKRPYLVLALHEPVRNKGNAPYISADGYSRRINTLLDLAGNNVFFKELY